MKREYSKPFLAVESFQLDAMVAASCSSDGKNVIGKTKEEILQYRDPVTLFFADNKGGGSCEYDAAGEEIDGDESDYCYQGPSYAISDFYMNS